MKFAPILKKITTQSLRIKLSKSFINALEKYNFYKSSTPNDLKHLINKTKKIESQIIKIAIDKKHLSKEVSYGNSKGLQYFVIEQHAVFFKITKTQLQVKYFVAVKRIKKSLASSL